MDARSIYSAVIESPGGHTSRFIRNYAAKPLLSNIFSIAEKEILQIQLHGLESEINVSQKAIETKNTIENIVERFERMNDASSRFLEYFPAWSRSRKVTIEELNKCADSIDKTKFIGNITTLVGSSVGFLGGAALIGSFVFPPLLPLAVGGGIASGLGGAAVFGSSVTELVLLKNRMNEAKAFIEKDLEEFRPLQAWFDRSDELMEALQEVLDFDLLQTLCEQGRVFYEEYKRHKYKIDEVMPYLKILVDLLLKGNLMAKFGLACTPVVISFVLTMFLVPMGDRLLCDRIQLLQRLTIGMMSGVDAGVNLGRATYIAGKMAKNAFRGVPTVAENMPRLFARSFKVFAGIGIALDATSVILTSIDLQNGSLSEQGKELKKAARCLQEEYVRVERVHTSLRVAVF
ncbi:uncharacterized protein CDAR_428421 [Caerostris darwini]|uniref:Apolipoprotein L3 n=1 Tax=Caerostris darwini TaxID=1538125 RepID=A0AAV4T8S9_9ARAC|nr:uncharacterized protein CDAR_428421 [Caerostris darwini]